MPLKPNLACFLFFYLGMRYDFSIGSISYIFHSFTKGNIVHYLVQIEDFFRSCYLVIRSLYFAKHASCLNLYLVRIFCYFRHYVGLNLIIQYCIMIFC